MKRFYCIVTIGISWLFFSSCTQETVTPEVLGSIEGRVLNSLTNEGIANVNVTTSPATNSILTNPDGSFEIIDIPTGQYSITASKQNFKSKTVNVRVSEDRFASANIFLEDGGASSSERISAKVTSFSQFVRTDTTTQTDSTFVRVEFQVTNESSINAVDEYEVYFKIFTDGPVFFKEIRDDSTLAAREKDFGQFEKFLDVYKTDSVKVSGTWTPDN